MKTNFVKNNKKTFIFAASLILTLSAVASLSTSLSNLGSEITADNSDWVHYTAIEPSKTKSGIKEFYVSCTSHEHTFVAPKTFTEGVWTEAKKSEITSNDSDDRKILSFNEVDATLNGVTGQSPFDFVKIKKAQNYIDGYYSEAAKGLYVVESNLINELKDYYDLTFEKCFDMADATFYNGNPRFSVSKDSDSVYDSYLSITINQDIATGLNPAFSITNFSNYFSSDNQSISFAVYSSEAAEFNLGLSYSDSSSQYMNFKFNVGWNEFTFAKGTTNYNYFTNAASASKTISQMAVVLVKNHTIGNTIKFASFIGEMPKSAGEIVKHKIANLPTQANLSKYDISEINDLLIAYDALDANEKAKVTNYSTLTSLKAYWETLYVLLYDMNANYAGVNTNATLDKRVLYDREFGYSLYASVTSAGTYIDLNNTNNIASAVELSSISYMIKPSQTCFMSWSNISNYGRSDDTEITLTANTWNEYVITGTTSSVSNVTAFLTYASDNNAMRNDFVPTTDKWGHYLVADVGFNYQMSSIIGTIKVDEAVNEVIDLIDNNCVDTPSLSKAEALHTIDTSFNALTTEQKEKVSNIEKYYTYKDLYSQSFPYMYAPSVKLHSWYQKTFITDDDFIYDVSTKYGQAYKFSFLKENYGTNITFDCGLGNDIENNGFYVYTKGFSNTLKLCSHEPTYGIDIATASPVSMGDGWYKYTFSKANYDALVAIGTGYRVSYCFGGHNLPNVDVYMSGTFLIPVTDGSSKATVQSHINTVNALPNDEFLGPKISEVQKEIVSLSTYDQAALTGQNILNSKYAQYRAKYASVYSMGVYRVGKWWTGTVTSITKSYDASYGDIYSVVADQVNGPYLTIGCWELNGTKGSHRGYGRELSPLPSGKYNSVSFAIYVPYNPSGSYVTLKCWDDGDVSFDLLTQTLVQGWNKITFTGESLNKLCGSAGSFKGISMVLPAKTDQAYEYKISSFIGEKNSSYTGEAEHYATDTLHVGAYNIESTEYQMIGASTSDYRFVASDSDLTSEAIGFINKQFNKTLATTLPTVNSATPSLHSRYIFVNDSAAMSAMGVTIQSYDLLGDTGYSITTVGSSVYIFAYGKEGYELAAAKFLEATIGYDWMANDMVNYEKNGVSYSSSITVYTPAFNVIERPDYDDRSHSNGPMNHVYGSTLEYAPVYNPSCCNVTHFLPTDEYSNCYYQIKVDEALHIDACVLCFNGKGFSSRRTNMIKAIGDKMIENDQLNLGYPYAALFQGDTSTTCNCLSCKNDINKHGSAAYTVVKFMNDLDDYIKANYAARNIKLIFLAYNATFTPPNDITCHDDVVPFVAPAGARWNHSFYEVENSSGVGENGYTYDNDFADKIAKWDAICKEYVMWAYQAHNGNFLYVYNTFESMYQQYRFFHNNGCNSMHNEGVTSSISSGYITLKDYLDSKAMFDVNGSYDEVYEKFFKYYYGEAGELMRIIFDEAIANVNFLADNYGRGTSYNPDSHASEVSGTHYYDGSMAINCYTNYAEFWNNTGNCYNGMNGSCNGKNIANISYWVSLADQAVSLTEHGDAVIFNHVKRDVIFPYYVDYEINGTSSYVGRICRYCYDTKCYWDNESNTRLDSYVGLTGTHTICYKLTGKTFKEMYES